MGANDLATQDSSVNNFGMGPLARKIPDLTPWISLCISRCVHMTVFFIRMETVESVILYPQVAAFVSSKE